MPTIYFIRHGETDWNATGRYQGTQDIPLNDKGRGQALAAGRLLADVLTRDGRAVAALSYVSSPLGRARVTMELVRGALGLPAEGYATDERLREITYGAWEGFTVEQMQASDAQVYAARHADRWNVAPLRGESYADRIPFITDWVNSRTTDTVAVGHVGTARTLMVACGVKSPAEALEGLILQGSVYVFRDGAMEIVS
ncbi:histidine phosphatase family protein [Rhodopseudomonas sp. HC1]|uniref:histidine phosphatase family protein n=1 Tax=Rhodopseudomonas infernalis TaxID=2897386 RepID=UPI001EE99C36|nr:histidine phosphatase family protein [Rhodopseudomonas infernalis]MCG6204872.1 histidine phosphatase family protein [Rhodopseudomonas infernalis]